MNPVNLSMSKKRREPPRPQPPQQQPPPTLNTGFTAPGFNPFDFQNNAIAQMNALMMAQSVMAQSVMSNFAPLLLPNLNDNLPLSDLNSALSGASLAQAASAHMKAQTMTITSQTEIYEEAHRVWICPFCKMCDDGRPMIGCDSCDDWYHW